jgi:ABC-type uncharacterized transport system permease subunit
MFFISRVSGTILLVALGLGYIVCYLANKETKFLRKLGFAIGAFIIVASSVLILAKAFWTLSIYTKTCGISAHHEFLREQSPK